MSTGASMNPARSFGPAAVMGSPVEGTALAGRVVVADHDDRDVHVAQRLQQGGVRLALVLEELF